MHSSRDAKGEDAQSAGSATAPDGQDGAADSDGTGKLIATENRNLNRRDLRDMVRPEEIAEAEDAARRIGAALRDKRSRRRVAARKGDRLHFRKTISPEALPQAANHSGYCANVAPTAPARLWPCATCQGLCLSMPKYF